MKNRKKRSVVDRMRRAKNTDTRLEIAIEWADDWHAEHVGIVDALKRAIDAGDMDGIRIGFGELRAVTEKKHGALHRVFNELVQSRDKDDEDEQYISSCI